MKGMWVGYDVGCTMGLTCGHGAWQIDRQSSGSMWNSYSFQPVGQWMSYSFTDLGAEGCCRSLNALFKNIFLIKNLFNNWWIGDKQKSAIFWLWEKFALHMAVWYLRKMLPSWCMCTQSWGNYANWWKYFNVIWNKHICSSSIVSSKFPSTLVLWWFLRNCFQQFLYTKSS